MERFLEYGCQGFVVQFNSDLSTVQIVVQTATAVENSKKLLLNLCVITLTRGQGF